MTVDTSDKGHSTKSVFAGAHCTMCGAKDTETELCSVKGGKVVVAGSAGSRVECLDLADCRSRKEKSGKPNKFSEAVVIPYVEKCRHLATEAFSIENLHFFGGSQIKVEDQLFDHKKWLVVSLLGKQKSDLWCSIAKWADQLRSYTFKPQLVIDWPDMGSPPLKPGFWNKLVSLAAKEEFTNVLFYCIGGHGRTGTALASVLVECCELGPKEAILYVRANYCDKAVESLAQVHYLELLEKHRKSLEPTKSEVIESKKKG